MANEDESGVDDLEPEADNGDDIALRPGANADDQADVDRYIRPEVRALYDVYSYRHAAGILANSYPRELEEIQTALLDFRITKKDIGTPGGNESVIPKKFSHTLRPAGWVETRIQGDLLVRLQEYDEKPQSGGKMKKVKRADGEPRIIANFIDGHKIDYVKGRVAFDMEWNSKDQTFDRDLYALRAFHECGLISAGVMVTRSASLNHVFDHVPQLNKAGEEVGKTVRTKYGASTTWMGKLLYRLNAGRHGGCPVLVFGITPKLIEDWNEQ
ncbi:BglII/BstYI family type II restriction endonuclease [Ralstonia pseudosolanacearum]|uniref:BglII/BstYI family type II restriction endonuclease n=1 Tax=Ralstonia pseudosolanacearum TaxID=1310165 RepID=UPI00267717D8|nr:BglII/BstYI family type II restriction endonuclease [Ralstonia pseudosolanacearum]MDO3513288.1 BglII/BstYI family type II restriction endonuclease [Ralstonia pseudosolanacearum]MDO3536483.1 BglII/BstYI family type II restriction endonuclease [Ralstonia pseudosolanacearum]MDO3605343.1 BglII/BstYI family type II restriction endonuclease [Ralstonia pseudosolanacearum]MDO3611762.1 BglII/BstYI family type II restriction endonuclease [Ralstonia pseudosolanacearum]MDO3630910.1 BglII/BstYI family t